MLILKPHVLATWTEHIKLEDLNRHEPKVPSSDPQVREEGVHVSSVISTINRRNTTGQAPLEEKLPNKMAQGLAIESYYMGFPWHKQTQWQPGGHERDGIVGSPDGITPTAAVLDRASKMTSVDKSELSKYYQHWCLEEFKSTYYSSKKADNIHSFKEWIQQMAAYLTILKKHKPTITDRKFLARLTVWWVMGDYKYTGEVPECRVWLLSYDGKDLEAFWKEFIRAKAQIPVPIHKKFEDPEAISKFLEE